MCAFLCSLFIKCRTGCDQEPPQVIAWALEKAQIKYKIRLTVNFGGEPYLFAHVWDELCLTQSCFPEASQIAKDRRSVLQFAPVENVVGASLGMPQRMTRGRSGRRPCWNGWEPLGKEPLHCSTPGVGTRQRPLCPCGTASMPCAWSRKDCTSSYCPVGQVVSAADKGLISATPASKPCWQRSYRPEICSWRLHE